ncbi:DUF4321 domain-containing protein [Paenibacillus psychroresistens]|uniref:DUF4321 domain-containing protein n=1 Tax=Paenibacillus psychroresistens TaxID=1778678 RepID=A0A6B8RH14_9BACL|nr:DUF4321 domain-containing protein [Paenibacillus psychroresistens]QGQ95389.1 DUF4321 domain-containing protein [Paenibacillus psychroresistens]
MKKTNLTLIIFIVLGLLAGTIIAELLTPVSSLAFLTKSAQMNWHPKADLQILKYDLDIQVKLNLISILCAIGAIWIYRRM